MEQEMFGQVLDEDELENELDALDAEMLEGEFASAPVERIGDEQIKKYREEHGIEDQVEEPAEPSKSKVEEEERVAMMA